MNKYKNELTITLTGHELTLRATFNALVETEEATGLTIIECIEKASKNALRLKDYKKIIEYGIKGAGGKFDAKQFEEDVQEVGIFGLKEAIAGYFAIMLWGGEKLKKSSASPEVAEAATPT